MSSPITKFDEEARIVWIGDPSELRYVREGVLLTLTCDEVIGPVWKGRLVGYAVAKKKHREKVTYTRRYWYLKKSDWDEMGDDSGFNPLHPEFKGYPSSAVNPHSVRDNELSSLELGFLSNERPRRPQARL